MKELLLIGGGGHCRSAIDVIEADGSYRIVGIVERIDSPCEQVLNYPVVGNDQDLEDLRARAEYAFIAVGQMHSADIRIALFESLKKYKFSLPVLVSPLAYVSRHADIGEGTVIMHKAVVNAGATIGVNCIVNSMALVEHDATIQDHCHLATRATVNGNVVVESKTFVGSGAVLREGICIGSGSVVGAGTTVLRDLPAYSVYTS